MFKVPLYSQFLDVKNKNWKRRTCGGVALKMVLDYWNDLGYDVKTPTIQTLIREGVKTRAYIRGIGWQHKGLIRLARRYGFNGKNFDWAKYDPSVAFQKLRRYLKSNPVLASIYKDLRPENSGHLIVLTGLKGSFVYYNDPASRTRKGISKRAGIQKFLKGWKRRIIIVYPER